MNRWFPCPLDIAVKKVTAVCIQITRKVTHNNRDEASRAEANTQSRTIAGSEFRILGIATCDGGA